MMKYVFSGVALDKVLRENSIRISRGELIVEPLEEAVPEHGKDIAVEDSKDVALEDTKSPKKATKKAKK